jgi:hypothetical protein
VVAGHMQAGRPVGQWVLAGYGSGGRGEMEEAPSAGRKRGKAGFIDTYAHMDSVVYGMAYGPVVGWMPWGRVLADRRLGCPARPGRGLWRVRGVLAERALRMRDWSGSGDTELRLPWEDPVEALWTFDKGGRSA